jgi:hypothetical protein
MKKIYTQKIIQYSLEGEKLNEFNSIKEAENIVNYDSIISCCNGKYKTAGGYIWRFEKDSFSLISKRDINVSIKCEICNSNESIRSMSMHLKWAHNLKTEEYILKYNEFRPKQLLAQQKLKTSEFECKECGKKLNSNQHLMYHITKEHESVTKQEYIVKHMFNNYTPLCKCGCGNAVTILENGKNCDLNKDTYSRDYIKGHWDWEIFSGISKQSKEEIELVEFIKTIYSGEIQTSIRNVIPKGEIDIYLPDINVGIEYNGLYWHSEKGGRFKDYHLNKLIKSQTVGIRLIQIFSDEWLNKKEIIKNKLKSIIYKTKFTKIYARKCCVKFITPNDKNIFLNKHHIQGADRSSIKLGLYYEEQLVGVMTFSKPRISLGGNTKLENIYELSRYATSSYIVGGALKLIAFFIKNYNPVQIYSYSDNRWTDSNNNMYLKMGFIKDRISTPNYFYTKDYLKRLHRYNFNKFRLKNMGADVKNQTEFQIMETLGYTKVWDCGTTKYILNINK